MEDIKVTDDTYNFRVFKIRHFGNNFAEFPAPKIGEAAIDFSATTIDGKNVRLSDFYGRPVVLEMSSLSCPHVVYRVPTMNSVASRHPEATFLVLYTREAHPGAGVPPIRTMQTKLTHARRLRDEVGEKRQIVVDDVEGTAHKLYGELPDAVFVFDEKGRIVFRSSWNDVDVVETVLTRLAAGRPVDGVKPRFKLPPLRLIYSVFRRNGWQSIRDFLSQFPAVIWLHIRVPTRM